jgi:hypothetical protein
MKRVVTVLAIFELFGDLSCSVMEYVSLNLYTLLLLRDPRDYRSCLTFLPLLCNREHRIKKAYSLTLVVQ